MGIRSLIMDINQVKFGNFSIGSSRAQAKKEEQKEEIKSTPKAPQENTEVDADKIFEAMSLDGLYFQNQIKKTQQKEVNPLDYLSQDRIDDIEAMMAEFESGVQEIASVINGEFGSSLPQDKANEIAAKIYAGE